MRHLAPTFSLLVLFAASCRDDPQHVFHAPAAATPAAIGSPTPVSADTSVTTLNASLADGSLARAGPSAKITAVADAATGAPVDFGGIGDSVTIMAIFTHGPAWPEREPMTVQLVLRGACDGIVAAVYPAPAPAVIAHQFHVTALNISTMCRRQGGSSARVVLHGTNAQARATSAALPLEFQMPR